MSRRAPVIGLLPVMMIVTVVTTAACGSNREQVSAPPASTVSVPIATSPPATLTDPTLTDPTLTDPTLTDPNSVTDCDELVGLVEDAHRLSTPAGTPPSIDALGHRAPDTLSLALVSINERREELGCVPAVDLDTAAAAAVTAQVATLTDCDQLVAIASEANVRGQRTDDPAELFTLLDLLTAAVDRANEIGC